VRTPRVIDKVAGRDAAGCEDQPETAASSIAFAWRRPTPRRPQKPTKHGSGVAAEVPRHPTTSGAAHRRHGRPRERASSAHDIKKAFGPFVEGRKGFRPLRRGDVRGEHDSCAKGDSNPHGVTH
jgi:hypothetical protein